MLREELRIVVRAVRGRGVVLATLARDRAIIALALLGICIVDVVVVW